MGRRLAPGPQPGELRLAGLVAFGLPAGRVHHVLHDGGGASVLAVLLGRVAGLERGVKGGCRVGVVSVVHQVSTGQLGLGLGHRVKKLGQLAVGQGGGSGSPPVITGDQRAESATLIGIFA